MLWELIATGFYIGKIKFAPGTVGTLLALPLIYIFAFKWWAVLIISLILFIVGVFASNYVIDMSDEEDPEEVIIDEIAGYFIAFLFVKPDLNTCISGFIIFRIIDILKPFPVNIFEKLPRGWGVMADDVVGGILTALILYFLYSSQ